MKNTRLTDLEHQVIERFASNAEESFIPCDKVSESVVRTLEAAGLIEERYYNPDDDTFREIEEGETFEDSELSNIFEVVPQLRAATHIIRMAISNLSEGQQVKVLQGLLGTQGEVNLDDLGEMLQAEINQLK